MREKNKIHMITKTSQNKMNRNVLWKNPEKMITD